MIGKARANKNNSKNNDISARTKGGRHFLPGKKRRRNRILTVLAL
jgi:hypothetical protein